jgi:hypothetical protein
MITRLIDIIIGLNACVGLGTWAVVRYRRKNTVVRYRRKNKPKNVDHVKQLEEENKEIDKMLEEMTKRK